MNKPLSIEALTSLAKSGKLNQAFRRLKKSVKGKTDVGIWLQLSGIYGAQGEMKLSLECCQQALLKDRNCAHAYSHMGNIYLSLGDVDKAMNMSRRAVMAQPDDPAILYNFSIICRNFSQYALAIQHLKRALEIRPDHAPSHYIIGSCYQAIGRLDELVYHYNQALRLQPDFIDCLVNLGFHYTNVGEMDLADEYFRKALAINANYGAALSGQADVLLRKGDKAAAYQLVRQMIDSGNVVANTLYVYSLLSDVHGDPEEVIRISGQLLQSQNSDADRGILGFALGRVYDKLEKYELAFKYYGMGNEANKNEFDVNGFREYIDSIIGMYDAKTLENLSRASNEDETPVFIIGMPRSGTSLIEQILSKHSRVYAAGELNYIAELAQEILKQAPGGNMFPAGVDLLSSGQFDGLARGHVDRLFELSGGPIDRVTDKMPSNYAYVGLIAQLFPRVKIIHCMRDPRDTCLSTYFQNFQNFQRYADDLEKIGHVYVQYRKLMAHWNEVMDIPILNIQYEEVVNNAEEKAREVVDFCGLEWEGACLDFHKSKRRVITASFDQVNKPIYTKSVARWKHYEKHLGRLCEILAPVL